MNQEILFRGFHPCAEDGATIYVEGKAVKGRWVYGDLLHWYNTDENKEFTCIIPNEYGANGNINIRDLIVIPSTVGQYTGKDDKNGVKIFKGDILQAWDYPKDDLTFSVQWYTQHASFNLMGINSSAFNVIGTIFDKEAQND